MGSSSSDEMGLSNGSSPRETSDASDRFFAWKTCKDYLQGAWQDLEPEEVVIKRIRYLFDV